MWKYFGPEGGISERELTLSTYFVLGTLNKVARLILGIIYPHFTGG